MAIVLEQYKTFGGAYGGDRTLSFDTAPDADDLVIASIFIESENAITIPSGHTLLGSHNNSASYHHCALSYKYNATGNSYYFDWTGDAINYGWVAAFSGVDATTPIDVSGTFDEANFSTLALDSVTTTVDNALHCLAAYHSNSTDFDAVSGYTQRFEAANQTLFTKVISPAGATGSQNVTINGAEFYMQGLSFALRPVAAPKLLLRTRRVSGVTTVRSPNLGVIRRVDA